MYGTQKTPLLLRLTICLMLLGALSAQAQRHRRWDIRDICNLDLSIGSDSLEQLVSISDTLNGGVPVRPARRLMPPEIEMPPVFVSYRYLDPVTIPGEPADSTLAWIADEIAHQQMLAAMRQQFMIATPWLVPYNYALLPEAPRQYTPEVNPSQHKLEIPHVLVSDALSRARDVDPLMNRRNWLHNLSTSLQFAQSYISPNWYQGGNGNINMILNADFNVKLNQAFHPNHLCELDIYYKLSGNNAPTDTVNDFNISEDVFRITGRLGYKAFHHWFYSLNLQFKTQLFNNYQQNSDKLQASFLSPGDLNLGLGMTYTYARPSGRFSIDSSLSPLAWNLKTCINDRIAPKSVGLSTSARTDSQIGITSETKLVWWILSNIKLTSRLYMFSDYKSMQGDFENTIDFAVTRFLSAQLFVHLRYDSNTKPLDTTRWHRFQLKEIISLGFSYTFNDF